MRVLFTAGPRPLKFNGQDSNPSMRICCEDKTSLGSYSYCEKFVDGEWRSMSPYRKEDIPDLLNLLELVSNTLIGAVEDIPLVCDHWGP